MLTIFDKDTVSSYFNMATDSFTLVIAYTIAACLCSEDVAMMTLASPTGTTGPQFTQTGGNTEW